MREEERRREERGESREEIEERGERREARGERREEKGEKGERREDEVKVANCCEVESGMATYFVLSRSWGHKG